MHVIAVIDTREALRGDATSTSRTLEAEGVTYEEARDKVAEQVPEGWLALSYRVPGRAGTRGASSTTS